MNVLPAHGGLAATRPASRSARRRTVIVGCGGIAQAHVLAVRDQSDRLELCGAMDIDPSRAAAFCAENGIPKSFDSLEQMLAETKPDLVQIATPPKFHVPLSILAMEAGAWVWCEKPLCGSLAELDVLQAAERRTGRHTACVLQNRFSSGSRHVRRLIGGGRLGAPRLAVCHTLWYRDASYFSAPWRRNWSTASGGTTVTHGIHAIDKLLYLLGPWRTVKAEAASVALPIEVDDVSVAIVTFESGLIASIVNSSVSPRQETYLRLDFEHATVECTYLYDCTNENWRFYVTAAAAAPSLGELQDFDGALPNSHASQLAELLDDMEQNRTPVTAGAEARRTLEFLHAIYKSALTGESVRRGSILPGDPFYRSFHGGRNLGGAHHHPAAAEDRS